MRKARSVRRLAGERRHGKQLLGEMKGFPWDVDGGETVRDGTESSVFLPAGVYARPANEAPVPDPVPAQPNAPAGRQVYIIELIYKFSSFLNKNEKKSAKDLLYFKKQGPDLFNLQLFLKVIKIIDNSNFNFKKRNFIFNLFVDDKGLLEELTKRRK